MILTGSRALLLRAAPLLQRKPLDFDFICTRQEFDGWLEKNREKVNAQKVYPEKNYMIVEGDVNCEFEIIGEQPSTEVLAKLIQEDKDTVETTFGLVPSLDMLFTIKSSHKYKKNSPHFWKTLMDYHIMRSAGAVIRPEWKEFYRMREKETYNYSHPNLNQSKENFFKDDGIKYVWDHDDIHKSVAVGERPAYTYYLKDGSPVQCDKSKFFALPHQTRINGIVEEAMVLAIERSLVPHPGTWTPEYAWKFALMKVLSSITSGWFREFGYDNAPEVIKNKPVGYWEKFQKDVECGRVKPFTKGY